MLRVLARFAVLGAILLVAACATSEPAPMASGFSSAVTDVAPRPAPRTTLRVDRPDGPGYAFAGSTFQGELIFQDREGLPLLTYYHDVDGVPTLVADMDLAEDWLTDGAQRFEGVSDRGVAIEIVMVSGPCEAAGRMHARFAQIRAGRTSYDGCAREIGPVISWSERLPLYLDAVAACNAEATRSAMAFVRGEGGHVTHARTENGADILRYRFGERGRWDCAVTGERARWSVVPASDDRLPGEGDPVFAPGRMPPPGDGCYLYERVETADGALIGALGQDVCSTGMAGAPGETPSG